MSDTNEKPAKKKGKLPLIIAGVAGVLLIGGGAGAGIYLSRSTSAHGAEAEKKDQPQLVLKGQEEEKKEEGGHGESGGSHGGAAEAAPPGSENAAKYASSYYQLQKEFTSNLKDSPHFIQIGIAVSTNYDSRVIKNVEANELAVRSAVLMTLSDTDEMQVFNPEGKKQLQKRLVGAINQVLTEKEGFGGVGNVYFTNFIVQ